MAKLPVAPIPPARYGEPVLIVEGLIGYLILLGRNGIDVALAYDLISCAPRSTEFVSMIPLKEEKNIVWTLEIVK